MSFIQDTKVSVTSQLPVSEKSSSSVASATSSFSTNKFQEISQTSRQKAVAQAEEIQSLLEQAKCCYQTNQIEQAQQLCEQVLEIDVYQSDSQYILGLTYTKIALDEPNNFLKVEGFKKAASYLETIRKNKGEKLIEALQALGYIYYNLNEWEKAVCSYQECFKIFGSEKLESWEEHLDKFVISLKTIVNKSEAIQVGIQFCQRLATSYLPDQKAYAYYFMALLHEIRGELNAALNNINLAMNTYDRLAPTEFKYESRQKALQKYSEIQNKYYYGRS
jgi:tetratricopeptide (TPR) repeat protein